MAKVRRKGDVQVIEDEGGNRALWLGGILAVLLLAVLVIAMIGRGPGSASVDTGLYDGIATEGRFLGDPNAPVLVREFLDFKCPHCQDASQRLIPEVIDNYVRDGQVRIEFIPVAILDQSQPGAEASACAAEQGGFLPYHEVLFANQRNTFNITNLTDYAGQAGLDEQAFRGCLSSGKYTQQIQENMTEFRRLGANSTPTFYVNDTQVIGAVPYDQLETAIEAQLSK